MSDNPHYEQIHYATISDDAMMLIPPEVVQKFRSIRTDRNDEERFKDDPMYQSLKKDYYKSKKEFEDYKFNIRNNQK
jgi:hypothetical protein